MESEGASEEYTLNRVLRLALLSHHRPSHYITVDKTDEGSDKVVLYWGDDPKQHLLATSVGTWNAFWNNAKNGPVQKWSREQQLWTGTLNIQELLGISIVVKEPDAHEAPSNG